MHSWKVAPHQRTVSFCHHSSLSGEPKTEGFQQDPRQRNASNFQSGLRTGLSLVKGYFLC